MTRSEDSRRTHRAGHAEIRAEVAAEEPENAEAEAIESATTAEHRATPGTRISGG
ncbi:hypothetical protein SAMN04487820_102325 [Actinopolyspora mzabensis]|uniref:Uncharacterized protein n=1 Tax=Actinopolyspora mzabensis TaxID=995066 RepID=A0A1G8X0L2_ACTMZ|nr:hypothetical protein SAMN04487820_102325 [Actinopolyspora mzabensis]